MATGLVSVIPHAWKMRTSWRSSKSFISWRGTAEPPHAAFVSERQVELGVLVGVAQQIGEDRRHAAQLRRALRGDQLRQRLGAEEAVGQDQIRAGERRAVGQPPRVGVEHRHHRQHAVRAREAVARRVISVAGSAG